MKTQTIREYITEAIEFYTRHADWERAKAEQATSGSKIQAELMMSSKFNEGCASAYAEMLERIG